VNRNLDLTPEERYSLSREAQRLGGFMEQHSEAELDKVLNA
jgi:hypothetical protein